MRQVFVGSQVRESWIRGIRTAGLYPLAGLLDYEDTRLKISSRVRRGLLLGVEGKLGNTDMYISSFVTDLV